MNGKSYINPQPAAVERVNKNCTNQKPTNLSGSEMEKNLAEKEKTATARNDNRSKQK